MLPINYFLRSLVLSQHLSAAKALAWLGIPCRAVGKREPIAPCRQNVSRSQSSSAGKRDFLCFFWYTLAAENTPETNERQSARRAFAVIM
jgi:hypothetical protein